MFASILSLLTSGAGGGIVGGILGLFKGAQERKERIEIEEIQYKRDELEYKARSEERAHEIKLLETNAQVRLSQTEAEIEGEIEKAHQNTLGAAQLAEFSKLNTTPMMDNYRASVRPTLAYVFSILFISLAIWSFSTYRQEITSEQGLSILLMLLESLVFVVNSLVSFYYVSRRNQAPKRQ